MTAGPALIRQESSVIFLKRRVQSVPWPVKTLIGRCKTRASLMPDAFPGSASLAAAKRSYGDGKIVSRHVSSRGALV